jgi:hypothetical protein
MSVEADPSENTGFESPDPGRTQGAEPDTGTSGSQDNQSRSHIDQGERLEQDGAALEEQVAPTAGGAAGDAAASAPAAPQLPDDGSGSSAGMDPDAGAGDSAPGPAVGEREAMWPYTGSRRLWTDTDRALDTANPGDRAGSDVDRRLNQDIRQAIASDGALAVALDGFSLTSVGGVVTLHGTVNSAERARAIADRVSGITGVERVINALQVAPR